MDTNDGSALLDARKGSKKQLQVAERNVLISKMIDLMTQGYMSTNALSKQCRVSKETIDRYRPLCDELIAKTRIDRNAIRALQIKRTYEIIESLMDELKELNKPVNVAKEGEKPRYVKVSSVKERTAIYGQIFKFSSHLALITGLNVETQVHVDPTKLVIIRSNKREKPQILDVTEGQSVTLSD